MLSYLNMYTTCFFFTTLKINNLLKLERKKKYIEV